METVFDPTSRPKIEPRPYQQRVISRAIELLSSSGAPGYPPITSLLIESPTGSGKTIMGLQIALHFQQHLGMSVGWCAMRRNLLAQAAAENEARAFNIDLKLISMFDKRPPQVDFLVVDEAQHDAALSMANLHSMIKPRRILGLSATPFRTDRFKLCFEKTLKDAGIRALIQDGYLSPYHHYTIPHYSPQAVAEAYSREADRWGQSLIFFHTMEHCRQCVEALRQRGVACELVSATSNREQQIVDFNDGKLRVLVNMLILSEGFDCPSLKTVFCRPSGKLCTIQMCGRVFRKHPSLPVKQIVQCEQTRYPLTRCAAALEQYLWRDEGWRSVGTNPVIDAMVQRMQSVIAGSKVVLPRMLTGEFKPVRTGRLFRRRQGGGMFGR